MEAFGKKDPGAVEKLLEAAKVMKAAGIPLDHITAQLGEGWEDKDPKALALFPLPLCAMEPYLLEQLEGLQIDLTLLPEGLKNVIVLPSASAQKPSEMTVVDTSPKPVKVSSLDDTPTRGNPQVASETIDSLVGDDESGVASSDEDAS